MAPRKLTRIMASRAAASTAEPEEETPKEVKAKKTKAKKKAAPKAKKTTKTRISVPIKTTKAKNIVKALKGKRVIKHASVYMAITCKSELHDERDFPRRSDLDLKENFDQEILGVFFSLAAANACAKAHCKELSGDEEDDDLDVDVDHDDDDDLKLFRYGGSDDDECCFDQVWVERRAIEDA
jgi:hypothetical protein